MDQDRVNWMGGPNQRGTLNIVWTCFATLALCAWTAVHPNLERQASTSRNLRARLSMMIVAIVFPEIIISAAWRQVGLVKRLRRTLRECNVSNVTSPQPDRLNGSLKAEDAEVSLDSTHNVRSAVPASSSKTHSNIDVDNESVAESQRSVWNDEQAFFAVMGGFAVETAYVTHGNREVKERHFLTAEGIEYLSLAGATPVISSEDVEERSNSDLFAKVIVVMQISWFAVQTIGRLAAHLPLSALEVHTVVHAGCAIIMYVLWKDKPYALNRPILLEDSLSKKAAALFFCKDTLREVQQEQETLFERASQKYWVNRAVRATRLEKGEVLPDDRCPPPPVPFRKASLGAVLNSYVTSHGSAASTIFGTNDGDCIFRSMAADALSVYNIIADKYPDKVSDLDSGDWSGLRQTSENFIVREVWGSWTKDVGHDMCFAKAIHFVFNLVYGLLHLAAWNSSAFPTYVERGMWRISSITIASVFVWGFIWVGYWKLVRLYRPVRDGDFDIFFGPFFWWGILFFTCSRCYLLVESLASLRSAPLPMYTEVQWASFLPHAG